MVPTSPVPNAALNASNQDQVEDPFLLEYGRYELLYQRRKARFLSLQEHQDVSKERLFVLSDDKPWEVFRNGYTTTRIQRRKFVFEHTRHFPPLHQACISGDRDQVRILLDSSGACVLERDVSGRIALHHAVINEKLKIAKKLLRRHDAKLQVHVQDNSSRTALHYVLEKLELLALHREGLRIPRLVTGAMRVESKRYRRLWELADQMLIMTNRSVLDSEEGSSDSIKMQDLRSRGDMWDVCRSGDLERLEILVKLYGCSKEKWELSELKRTLLHEACENQHLQIVFFLISTMAIPVLAQDTSGGTALHCAARRGYLDVCQMILGIFEDVYRGENTEVNAKADEMILIQDVRGRTALHWCLLGSCVKTAVFLARSCPLALHVCDQDGVSPLHLAIWRGALEIVQEFICLGANVCRFSAWNTTSNYGQNVGKAPWAPCGVVFQRPRLRNLEKVVPITANKAPDSTKKRNPDWETLHHPVEALWYWTRQPSQLNLTSLTKSTESKEDEPSETEAVTGEELGCRKYGGICCRCKLVTTGASTNGTRSIPKENHNMLLSPLILSLRMCALNSGNFSSMDDRVAIVKLILKNGAVLDEVDDNKDPNVMIQEVKTQTTSALGEGLRSAIQCPQIISMLLRHGAERINMSCITQWISSSVGSSKQVEAVLRQLLDLEAIISSSEFLFVLFQQNLFFTLRTVVKLWLLKPLKESTAERGDSGCDSVQLGSPWKSIYDSLVFLNDRRKMSAETRRIGAENLEFLCGIVQYELGPVEDGASGLCDCSAWQLFEYCITIYLRQQRNNYHREIGECEQIVLRCIRMIFKHCKSRYADGEQIKTTACTWLELTIWLGYFDCALMLLETMHQLWRVNNLLDVVLEYYTNARRRYGDMQFCYHREFLSVVVQNLLKVRPIGANEEHTQPTLPPATAVLTTRSIVHMVANNLPFALVKACFEITFSMTHTNISQDQLNGLKTMRVGGRTMIQWIIMNARYDILQLLFTCLPAGFERGLWWGAFISASTHLPPNANDEMRHNSPNFVDILISSVFPGHVKNHLGLNECNDLLVSLMIKHVIPTGSVELLNRLLILLESIDNGNSNEREHFGVFLKQARMLHTIARWNAIRVAEFFLSKQGPRGELQLDLQQKLIQEIQECHTPDACTPMELCRQLGHLHLYKLLSFTVQTNAAELKTDNKIDQVNTNDPELVLNFCSDTDKKPTDFWQVGLLRTIVEINQNLVAKGTEGARIENFAGYQRPVNIQDLWVSAVTQNQVSHLQAMSLLRSQSSGLSTSMSMLILVAIKHAALDALKWILAANTPITAHLSDEESIECLQAAAKHPGVAYAEMTLLLLEHRFSPGRLSGDGMGIPLLHRVACFANTTLACQIMTMLLERPDSDVNALDAFGNTAITYALAAGRLHNVCFLIQNPKCRLEAEYEGQSCFYYVLHIVPSFSWRTIVRELLLSRRGRAFLHCDADNKTCGCKSYEHPRGDGTLCGFCGHESVSHRLVPLPSWFRDQYDSYIVAAPKKRCRSNSDESGDSEPSQYSAENNHDAACDEDEEIVLENDRGRLDIALLKRITVLRYGDILHTNGLSVTDRDECIEDTTVSVDGHVMKGITITDGHHEQVSEVVPDSSTKDVTDVAADLQQCVGFNGENVGSNRRKFIIPKWLRSELAMVHSPRCLCQKSAFVTSSAQLVHVAVCRWLRHTAKLHARTDIDLTSSCTSTESPIVALASVQPAFEHWRSTDAVSRPPTPLPRILRTVLFHWRFGVEFLAFQRWKAHQTNAEVTQHRLTTRLAHVAAEMRRNRFVTLQLRQQQLQDSARTLLSP